MAQQSVLTVPLLVASLLSLPSLAGAAPPEDLVETEPVPVPVQPELVTAEPVVEPALEPVVEPAPEAVVVPAPVPVLDDEPLEMAADHPDGEVEVEDHSRRTTLELESGYVSLGIAPGMTFHHKGFHPNTRFELEFGGTFEHDYRDLAFSFGVVTHLTPYYERAMPSVGADVTATALLGPIYLRTGLGAVGGLPRGHMLHEKMAGVGGVLGAGLSFGRAPMVRVGVDYDLRFNTKGEAVHTGFLVLRLVCCRRD